MEKSEHDMRGKSKRSRTSRRSRRSRRRSKGKGTSSLEVREKQKVQEECDFLPKFDPSTFCTTFPRHGSRAVRRNQLLVDRKDQLLYQSKRAAWAVAQKNAVVQLNELRPGLCYEITSETGPLHAPVFSVTVDVDGLHFEGRGLTKKRAKMKAAELALRSFIQFPNASQAHAIMENFTDTTPDFTADKLDSGMFLKESEPENHCNTSKLESLSSIYNHKRLVHLTLDLRASANPKCQALGTSLLEHLSPVVLLDQLRPGLRYVCLAERVHGRLLRRFVMVVRVEGRMFEGYGHSKKLAKAQAAAAALQSLYNVSLGPERTVMRLQSSRAKNQLPQFFAESVFHLVREKFAELTNGHFVTSGARYKVLAGIVMTRGFDLRSAQVVSLATGTKCLDLDDASDCNLVLSDCHAEVLSRRALVRFLYAQLELLLCKSADHDKQSIFVRDKSGGPRLRDGVLFHMYVSSSPCGDARLNCPYESTAAYSSRKFRCRLRVKVNGGEGTLPVTARRANQMWEDGALPGKPLVPMSCTDKMAKWNVVGLQGALLSQLVEPVYLHSLTVGTLSHTGHLSRALTRRLAAVRRLPFPYRRQQLLLSCLRSSDVRPAGKPPNVSVNWSFGDKALEEISTSTGRRRNCGMPSQLCGNSLFSRWQRLQQQISGADVTMETYCGSKKSAERYQGALQQFTAALQAGGLGTWLRKCPQTGHVLGKSCLK